jgi:hypothetical protein
LRLWFCSIPEIRESFVGCQETENVALMILEHFENLSVARDVATLIREFSVSLSDSWRGYSGDSVVF